MTKSKFVSICGNKHEIEKYIKNVDGKAVTVPEGTSGAFPVIKCKMMSDYKWQLSCLNDRLEHPEKYEEFENVSETIAELQKWLTEHSPKAVTV